MNPFSKVSIRPLFSVGSSFFLSVAMTASVQAAPGPIADVPLVTQGGAKPNLMILLDSSGSMGEAGVVSGGSPLIDGKTRLEIAQQAATDLVYSLEDGSIRVGLAQFDGSSGARIIKRLTLLDQNEKNNIASKIGGVSAGGVTPLAEAASDIGRYFTSGYDEELPLVLHPENSFGQVESSEKVSDIFIREPKITDSGSAGDSVQFYCQKNFFMLLTDGLPNGDDSIGDSLKDYDSDCSIADNGNSDVAPGEGSGKDDRYCRSNGSGTDYLDDVTTAMFDMDLRPDLKGPDLNNPIKNNVSSYMVGFAEDSLQDNDLLTAAARQAGGDYIYASNSEALQGAFRSILTDIFSKVGASSAASFNSTSLSNSAVVYLASYNSESWSGGLVAQEMNADGTLKPGEKWRAEDILDDLKPEDRLILTYKGGKGVSFTDTVLGSESPDILDQDLGADDGLAEKRLAYIRGVRASETDGTNFRRRATRLGDIVHSTPTFVGVPNFDYPNSEPFGSGLAPYSKFVESQSARKSVVYVGANDGMLHGFDAESGEELIAYVPELLISAAQKEGLHYLTSQDYGHKYYVDLTPTVADVFFDDEWHTVLVGGLGAGGKGYFMLDITDPADFSAENAESIVLDEFGADDPDMGLSFSRPKIALLNNDRWAAIFGNGYNSDSGEAVLYVYYFDNGDVLRLRTGKGTVDDKNGLSTPSLADVDGDGVVDRVYAGDVQGNLWTFDLCDTDSIVCKDWEDVSEEPLGELLFSTGGEPITSAPRIARNTDKSGNNSLSPNLLVLFGSGQYLNGSDLLDTKGTAYYGVWDKGHRGLDSSDLAIRSIVLDSGLRRVAGSPVDWSTQYGWKIPLSNGSGEIGDSTVIGGERVVTESLLLGSVLFFNTAIPSTAVCSSGGTGYLMSVDFRSGLAPRVPVFDANNDGVIDDADKGFVGELPSSLGNIGNDSVGGEPGIPTAPAVVSNDDGSGKLCINVNGAAVCGDRQWYVGSREGRLSWQELTPY
ncbi:PilC/PilY family type IV pilus protein [Microbulbifer guangxiensis]|uniref:PilC/PilY family type IV pilus protein n=1 Tax=Microbulbifer guangxiensis TaxID=2904249 RepID=UPI001F1D0347|nr:PilC/PilY family type IV pilus protein [Microbulbifer guangxiensis]